jgi:hypothetical protein
MTKELLEQVATMDLRDQLEAKEQMIKESKESISRYQKLTIKQAELLTECRNWLKGLILCTLPMESTKDLEDLIEKIDEVLR